MRNVSDRGCREVQNTQTRHTMDGFSLNLVFEFFSKICRENSSFTKILLECILYVIYVFLLYDCMFMYDYPDWGFSRAFSSVVRQIPGWCPQRRGTARTLPNVVVVAVCIFCVFYVFFVLFYVLFVLWRSLYCLCIYVYWTTATGWLPNCS
jgi:hypothetical protein